MTWQLNRQLIKVVQRVGLELSLISKSSQENICNGVGFQQRFRLQAVHLRRSGFHHACFPRNSRTAIFRNISEQLFQLFSQTFFTCFCKTPRISCSVYFPSFLRMCLLHGLKGKFNFWIAFNFRYSGGALRTPVKDLRWSFL